MNLLEVIAKRESEAPHAVALEYQKQTVTYAELCSRAQAIAVGLRARGLGAGDRVLFVAENSSAYVAFVLGVWLAGGIVATAYATSGDSELAYIVRNAAPRIVMVSPSSVDAVRSALAAAGITATLIVIDAPDVMASFPDVSSPAMAINELPETPSYLCYTSGSTAHPKAVLHSATGICGAVLAYRDIWHVTPADRFLIPVPLAWAFGLMTSVMVALSAGARAQIVTKFRPHEMLESLNRERPTVVIGVTTLFVKTLDYARSVGQARFASTLRFCVSGGEPRNEQAFVDWQEATGCAVYDVYGATEAFPAVTYDPMVDPQPRRGSAGRVVGGCSFRIVDEQGSVLTAGGAGEAQWRSPATMLGYWGDPENSAKAMTADGFYRSGDQVRLDADGYVYVEGRYSDLILHSGANVSPIEVETVLREHPSVAECAVCGLPDRASGQLVAAAVVVARGYKFNAGALQEHCAARLAKYKRPTVIVAIERLPSTPTGKVKRRDLVSIITAQGQVPA